MSKNKASSPAGASKSKGTVRGLFRDVFGRSSSHKDTSSVSLPLPPSRPSDSSGAPNETLAPNNGSASLENQSSTGERPVPSHSVSTPLATSTTGAQSGPVPPPSEAPTTSNIPSISSSTEKRSATSQSTPTLAAAEVKDSKPDDAPASPQPNSPLADTPSVESVDKISKVKNVVWTGLKRSLEGLRDNPAMFSHLSSAAGILLDCFDGLQTSVKNQQENEDLVKELTTISESIKEYIKPPTPAPLTKGISSVTMEIEQQAKEIEAKMSRGSMGRLVVAEADEEEVMRRCRHIQSLFRQLQTNLSASTWSIANEHLVNTRLEGLNPVKQATYDSTLASTISRRSCTEGTRTGILSDLGKWVDNSAAPSVYWMNGMAGTGKTTIAYTFCEQLEHRKLLGASFFCTRTTAECRLASRIIPTIAYQLARYSIPFQTALYEVLGDDPDLGSRNIQKQFGQLLRVPLLKAKHTMPTKLSVVIDALDECEDRNGVETILDMLFRHAADVPLKFFLTSRPEPEIYDRMMLNVQSRSAFHLHDIETSLVQADIELYLNEELGSTSPTKSQIEQLAQRSGSLFIYAATLARYIRFGKRFADPRQRLQSVLALTPESSKKHAEIDALYTAILASALEESRMEDREVEDIKLVLRTVLLVQEPVSVETIAALSGIEDPGRVGFAFQPLRSVLHQSEDTKLVSTLHASFPDFMSSHERSGEYFCDIMEHSQVLAERCFKLMKEQLRFNICGLESSFVLDSAVEDMRERIGRNVSPALAYACRYWASHLALASKSDNLVRQVEEFICDRLLSWIEVLSLRQDIAGGIETLLRAKEWLNQAGLIISEAVLLVEDARNFVTGFASSPASQSTPHIYISSLPLCPRSSTVYKNYWHRTSGLLELKGSLMERREGAALATWDIGSTIYSVAYSPDGSRVAVGCGDHTVKILNAHDGSPLVGPLPCPNDALSVTFSPDSTLVASGSGRVIHVWNAYNGSLVAGPFEGHAWDIWSVAFSPDGSHIVSGSIDKTVRIWNTHDGTLIRGPLEGHSDAVVPVAYSPDGTLIASASYDRTVRLWCSRDGTLAHSPFEGHTDKVISLAFTPDGTRLVTGSFDNTIRVWNISEGSPCDIPFEGHKSYVYSVAVSPDGTRIASGSDDKTVRVWNIEDGTLVSGPFIGHTNYIWSVAYSPDGTRVISGSQDRTLRVWNVRDGLIPLPTPFKDHISQLNSILSIGNGAQILSSSADSSVWCWDISANTVTPGPTSVNYNLVSFPHSPPTAPYVLVHTQDGISVFDTNTGSLIISPSFDRFSYCTTSTFSVDNTRFATGSVDGSVRIWDLPSAKLIGVPFCGHGGEVTSVLLSPDSTRAFSCSSSDKTIRVWNVQPSTLQVAPPLSSPVKPSSDFDHASILEDWHIQEDGWVVNGSSHLLFWIPPDLRQSHIWPSPHIAFIISEDGILHIPEQELLIGDQWSRCLFSD